MRTLTLSALLLVACGESGGHHDLGAPDAHAGGEDLAHVPDAAMTDGAMIDDAAVPLHASCTGQPSLGAWTIDPKMCVTSFAEGISAARGMTFAPNGDLLVVESGTGIVGLHDDDGDGHIDAATEQYTVVSMTSLNHGITFSPDGSMLYASDPGNVYRWAWTPRTTLTSPTTVIDNIPTGGHVTRTLLFDSQGRLLVTIGSASNLDTDPSLWTTRGMTKRFTLTGTLPLDASVGEPLAKGMRNEVGITYDADGRLWGVENGRDDATFNGVDVHLTNPGEELNLIDDTQDLFYGYPLCWSEFMLEGGGGPTTQHHDEQIPMANLETEAWCQDPTNVVKPMLVMPAHWAPLSVIEYTGGSLPWNGSLLVTSHGSWDHVTGGQVGRVLARVDRDANGMPTAYTPVLGEMASDGTLAQGTWSVRPVEIRQGPQGELYLSSDASSQILRIGYAP